MLCIVPCIFFTVHLLLHLYPLAVYVWWLWTNCAVFWTCHTFSPLCRHHVLNMEWGPKLCHPFLTSTLHLPSYLPLTPLAAASPKDPSMLLKVRTSAPYHFPEPLRQSRSAFPLWILWRQNLQQAFNLLSKSKITHRKKLREQLNPQWHCTV